MYKVGYPFWKAFARAGLPVSLRVDVLHDAEVDVFIATSPDLRGLVVEAKTVEELIQETNSAIEMLMEQYANGAPRTPHAWFNFHNGHVTA